MSIQHAVIVEPPLTYAPDAFLYVYGGAGNCAANSANTRELAKWKIIPRMLRDATVRNLEVSGKSDIIPWVVITVVSYVRLHSSV